MSRYEKVRAEFHKLQQANELDKTQVTAIEVIRDGRALRCHDLPPGLNGICIYKRKNGTLICEEAFLGGAVDGYARYYDTDGSLVGEDYYEQGGVTQTRVFK